MLAWQRGLGSTFATRTLGDADLDFQVTGADLALWAKSFASSPIDSNLAAAPAVPEPVGAASATLTFLSALAVARGSRK